MTDRKAYMRDYMKRRRAGVTPHCIDLDGQDSVSYILSANINRRHLSKGQRAMAVARISPEPQKLRCKDSSPLEIKGLNSTYVSQARFVLRHASDLADSVINGSLSLDKAYEEACLRKGQADSYVDIRTFLSYSGWREREAIHQAAESPRCQDHQKTGQRGSRTRRACRASSADPDAR